MATGGLLAPSGSRTLVEAAILVPLSLYNAWVTRDRVGYWLIGVALVMLGVAVAFPPHPPTGPEPP